MTPTGRDEGGVWGGDDEPRAGGGESRVLLEGAEVTGGLGSWSWHLDTDRLSWSSNMFRLAGLEPREGEPTLDDFLERVHPPDRARVATALEDLRSGEGVREVELRFRSWEEELRHWRAAVVGSDGVGRAETVIGVVHDVTLQRHADRQIDAAIAIAGALADWESFDAGAERLLGGLARAMEFFRGGLYVPQDDALVARAMWQEDGFSPSELSALERIRLPRGMGAVGRAWELRGPISIADVGDLPTYEYRDLASERVIHGVLAIPALAGDDVLAVLGFASQEAIAMTGRTRAFVESIGAEIGEFLARRRGDLAPPVLTARELEVLRRVAEGLSNSEVAECLGISPSTVKTHLEHIYKRLGAPNRALAVAEAVRKGLIE